MTTSQPFDTALIKNIDDENGRETEKTSQLTNAIPQQQQQVTTTTTGISFISNGLQMQIIHEQSIVLLQFIHQQQRRHQHQFHLHHLLLHQPHRSMM